MTGVKQNKMGEKPVLPLLITMALPAMFSMLIQSLYNIVDSIFVSRLGEEALRAVTIAYPMQQLMIAFFVGTAIGANSFISRSLGMQAQDRADSAGRHGFFLSFMTGLAFAIIGFILAKPFYQHFTSDPAVQRVGMQYFMIVTIFSFGSALQINIEKTLQATGDMIHPMIIQIIGAVVNIVLDPLLIFGIGFFPKLGVMGAAIATVAGQMLGMAYGFYVLFIKDHEINISMKKFKLDKFIVKEIYSVGFPSIVMASIASFMVMFMNSMLKPFSEAAITVLGIYYKLQSFVFMPVFGLTQGAMPILGYNYGAGNKDRFIATFKYAIIIVSVIMISGMLAFQFAGHSLLSIFDATEEMYIIGVPALKRISLCFFFAGVSIIISVSFQAIGMGFNSLALSIVRQLLVILPLFKYFSTIRLDLVWYAFPIAEIVCFILSILLFAWVYRRRLSTLSPLEQGP